MGLLGKDKPKKPKRLRKVGDAVRYRTFPIRKQAKGEFHVYMGFSTQEGAEDWVDESIKQGVLQEAEGVKKGAPKKP